MIRDFDISVTGPGARSRRGTALINVSLYPPEEEHKFDDFGLFTMVLFRKLSFLTMLVAIHTIHGQSDPPSDVPSSVPSAQPVAALPSQLPTLIKEETPIPASVTPAPTSATSTTCVISIATERCEQLMNTANPPLEGV